MYRKSLLRKRFGEGKKAFGCWVQILDPEITEMLSMVGFDFLLIDNEHGPGDVISLLHQLRAAAASDTTPVVRIPWNDPIYIKKILDIGVEAVMVPMVETVEQAEAAVAACRYPPRGIRGIAHTDARASDYGLKAKEYLETASDNVFIICQVESATGVENVEAIAAVDGIDMVFIGPVDLSASLGRPADFDNPRHKEAMAKSEAAIKAAGKSMGGIGYGPYTPKDLYERGYDLIVGAADVGLLRDSALEKVKQHSPS